MSVAQFCLSGTIIIDFINRKRALEFFNSSIPKVIILFLPFGFFLIGESVYNIFRRFLSRENMPAIVFSSILLLHVIGLIYTTDFAYAFKDIRIKLPIFILPVIISVSPSIDYRKFRFLMLLFAAAVVAGTLITTQVLLTHNIEDPRNISIFISHIRFSLLIVYAIFVLLFFSLKGKEFGFGWRLLMVICAVWLVIYLIISASMTGLAIFAATLFIYAIVMLFRSGNLALKILVPSGIVLALVLTVLFLSGIVKDVYKVHPIDLGNLDKTTANGSYYWNDTTIKDTENGHYVWVYIATLEMREAWNSRSKLDFDGEDERGQILKFTLMRYLTSKGYRKDAEGVHKLSDDEVRLIEQGVASVVYHEKSRIYVRLYKMIWGIKQYQVVNDPSGMSFLQRLEYWKASSGIVSEHWLAGVGTGDLNEAFAKQYRKMESPLPDTFRLRSHNQYLAILIGFGVFGLLWFLVSLIYPPYKIGAFSDYFYLLFFIIITLSMLTEDTIETQAGATIYGFFTSLLLFGRMLNRNLAKEGMNE